MRQNYGTFYLGLVSLFFQGKVNLGKRLTKLLFFFFFDK